MYWRFTPAVELPFFSCPVSSSAATASSPAGGARCSATNRRITPIAVVVSHTASLSSRCIRSGVRSPACSASVQEFLRGRSLINPMTYLRACCSGSTRAKQRLNRPCSSPRFSCVSVASTMAAAAAS